MACSTFSKQNKMMVLKSKTEINQSSTAYSRSNKTKMAHLTSTQVFKTLKLFLKMVRAKTKKAKAT